MNAINQKQYLKKYLSIGSDPGKKKKKKRPSVKSDRLKIIDDDEDIKTFTKSVEEDLLGAEEDAPQIVGVIDDRPLELKVQDYSKSGLWKPVISDDAENSHSSKTVDLKQAAEGNENVYKEISSARKGTDFSPVRNRKNVQNDEGSSTSMARDNDFSPARNVYIKEEELTPPRKQQTFENEDCSPPRKYRNDSSPIRRNQKHKNSSPPRRNQHIREEESYSPKSIRCKDIEDSSPTRRNRKKRNSSPPRRNQHIRKEESPPKRIRSKDHEDASPPRKRTYIKREDLSPPVRTETITDIDSSPPRRNRHIKQEDSSPPRRSRNITCDAIPTKTKSKELKSRVDNRTETSRRSKSPVHRNTSPSRSKRKSRWDNEESQEISQSLLTQPIDNISQEPSQSSKMTKTLDGKTAGLQNARDLVKETQAFKKREDDLFKNMSAEVSGVNASTVLRDRKTGKKRDLAHEAEKMKEKKKKESESREKYNKWGKGLKQVEDYNEKLQEDAYEMSKPLARYADDEDLERHLKEQEREGDPMLAYIRKKKKKKFVEQGKPVKPQYEGEFMPNRFGIRPGHRWDGVDRSIGYEKKWFEIQNSKKADQEEIYKWSTEDM